MSLARGISWVVPPFGRIVGKLVLGSFPSPRDWSHFYALHAGRSGSPAGNWVTASLPLEFLLRSSPGGPVVSGAGKRATPVSGDRILRAGV